MNSAEFPVATIPLRAPESPLVLFSNPTVLSTLYFTRNVTRSSLMPGTSVPLPSAGVSAFAEIGWNYDMNIIEWKYADSPSQLSNVSLTSTQAAATDQPFSTPTVSTDQSANLPQSPPTPGVVLTKNVPEATKNSTTASRPKSTTTSSENYEKGVPAAAVAGVAIGCLIAGAVIIGLLICLYTRYRSSQKGRREKETDVGGAFYDREKNSITKSTLIGVGSPALYSVDTGRPQPFEDNAISGEFLRLESSIKNHVHSFYHRGRVSFDLPDIDQLLALDTNRPISNSKMNVLLDNSTTREVALRFCIARVLVCRMSLSIQPEKTLLPPEIAQCLQSMRRKPIMEPSLLTKWREITAQLLQPTYGQNLESFSDLRNNNIEHALNGLEPLLLPFADTRVEPDRRRHNLEEIFKRAALFAFMLFSQPGTFDYDWEGQQGMPSGSLCIFPALMQVADETGKLLMPRRAFSEAVERRMDG